MPAVPVKSIKPVVEVTFVMALAIVMPSLPWVLPVPPVPSKVIAPPLDETEAAALTRIPTLLLSIPPPFPMHWIGPVAEVTETPAPVIKTP